MSVLGLDEVLKRVKEENLIENLGERELNNPEGVGVDLRLGEVYEIVEGGAFIEGDRQQALGNRKGVKTQKIEGAEIVIKPGDYFLVTTMETLNTPKDLMPIVYSRSSLFRAGLLLLNTKTDPGYKGKLTMGLKNLSAFEVKLQIGARICNLVFHKIDGEIVEYRGQHQGGRITPEKEEKQV